jgi:hypothetical protein
MLQTTAGDVISKWHCSNEQKLQRLHCHELQTTRCTFVRCLSDLRLGSGSRSIVISTAIQPHLSPYGLYTPASLYQSFSLRVLDVVMDHQQNIHVKREKKIMRGKKTIEKMRLLLLFPQNIPATFESSLTTPADFNLFILFVLRDFVCILQALLTVLLLVTSTLPVFVQ